MTSAQSPIFIAAPARRSGTTLMQRLCIASGEAMIFGESAANDLLQAGMMLQIKQQNYSYNSEWRDGIMAEVREGKVNQWIPDLLPNITDYLSLHAELLDQLCLGFATAARCSRWGVKLPEWPVQSLVFWQNRLPESRTIYILRDVEECVQSAFTMGMLTEESHKDEFRQIHQQHLAMAKRDLSAEQTYFLDYGLLTAPSAEEELARVAAFLNLKSLPASVLEVRVGNY
ncbi:sulfotransferase [Neolewinella agarilytica]|uniref:Sulfotransferase family protein n=1 Tax=Neolewinella agarilytica TaxID=478744 RepID=A0A1H9L6Y0_9BACT|nr:sulfotransferase [Neolewinella agarilytica]SER07120.1 Sulfotransferase family protein [Neolewinella agarilytica]